MFDSRQAVLESPSSTGSVGLAEPTADRSSTPIAIKKPLVTNGTIVYGLVARVAMSQPGFGFRVEHDLPVGVELVEAKPKAKVVGDHLIWQFGRVDPGQEVRLEIVIRPYPETEIKPEELAVFSATYSHNLYFQVPVVRPRLTTRWSGPSRISHGETADFCVEVANIGSWVANKVRARFHLPPGLRNPNGAVHIIEVGDINPGEIQRVPLSVFALARGKSVLKAEVAGSDDKHAVIEFQVEVS